MRMMTLDDVGASSVSPDTVVGDEITRRYMVHATGEAVIGAPVWDGSGRLIGVVDGGSNGSWLILPAHSIRGTLASLLSGVPIKHATLGVRVIHEENFVTGSSSSLVRGGEVISPDRRTGAPAITRKGPLDGVLREGDVIERVEREVLDGSVELSELLLEYPIGTTISIHARRGKDGLDVSVVLGSVETGSVIR
jgi:S1-C subfamily serine protease